MVNQKSAQITYLKRQGSTSFFFHQGMENMEDMENIKLLTQYIIFMISDTIFVIQNNPFVKWMTHNTLFYGG